MQLAGCTPPAAPVLIEQFAARYGNRNTRRQYVQELTDLFAVTGRTHPRALTESDVLAWSGDRRYANNTIRNRHSRVCTFLRWCVRQGECGPELVEALSGPDNPIRRIPKLYGKVQSKHPARFLTHDQAYAQLIGACPTDDIGLRDELLLRLGLSGLRAEELISLRLDTLRLDLDPITFSWIGKGRRHRTIVAGPSLTAILSRYLARYRAALGRDLRPDDPVICREKTGGGAGQLSWGHRIAQTCSVRRIVLRASERADLGHLAPHDLRRTAASVLHHATTDDGAHHFDLLDIQKVLDHQDPAATMRSYLDPMDTTVKQRASRFLD